MLCGARSYMVFAIEKKKNPQPLPISFRPIAISFHSDLQFAKYLKCIWSADAQANAIIHIYNPTSRTRTAHTLTQFPAFRSGHKWYRIALQTNTT